MVLRRRTFKRTPRMQLHIIERSGWLWWNVLQCRSDNLKSGDGRSKFCRKLHLSRHECGRLGFKVRTYGIGRSLWVEKKSSKIPSFKHLCRYKTLDPPSSAKLTYTPSKVIKAGQVELHCSVDNPGKPENLTYEWRRGIHKLSGESGPTLVIKPVKLDTRNNFTCMAMNEGGNSDPATVFINVSGNSLICSS